MSKSNTKAVLRSSVLHLYSVVKQIDCVVGELRGKDSRAGWRECQETTRDGWLPHCSAWPWFNEGQK